MRTVFGRLNSAALFIDAAQYWKNDAYVVTVGNEKGCLANVATVVTRFTHEAEELAITVALH